MMYYLKSHGVGYNPKPHPMNAYHCNKCGKYPDYHVFEFIPVENSEHFESNCEHKMRFSKQEVIESGASIVPINEVMDHQR